MPNDENRPARDRSPRLPWSISRPDETVFGIDLSNTYRPRRPYSDFCIRGDGLDHTTRTSNIICLTSKSKAIDLSDLLQRRAAHLRHQESATAKRGRVVYSTDPTSAMGRFLMTSWSQTEDCS